MLGLTGHTMVMEIALLLVSKLWSIWRNPTKAHCTKHCCGVLSYSTGHLQRSHQILMIKVNNNNRNYPKNI